MPCEDSATHRLYRNNDNVVCSRSDGENECQTSNAYTIRWKKPTIQREACSQAAGQQGVIAIMSESTLSSDCTGGLVQEAVVEDRSRPCHSFSYFGLVVK
eukprot:6156010-Amphidinium_carterae.3